MARYADLFGHRVQVLYRAGDMHLPATGTLVADSGKSIFLEESFSQQGKVKAFRWEIPYPCVISLVEVSAPRAGDPQASSLNSGTQTLRLRSIRPFWRSE